VGKLAVYFLILNFSLLDIQLNGDWRKIKIYESLRTALNLLENSAADILQAVIPELVIFELHEAV